MELTAAAAKPMLCLFGVPAVGQHQPPVAGPMVHVLQMRDLMRGDIVEHEGWRQDEAPGLGETSGGGA